MSVKVNDHLRPGAAPWEKAVAARRVQGAHNAAARLLERLRELSHEDLRSVLDAVTTEAEDRGVIAQEEDELG